MLEITTTSVRLFLHVLGATVWFGGQVALAGIVPTVRRTGSPEVLRAVARQFQRIAWPAYALLLITGIWNIVAIDVSATSTEYQITLFVKLLCVALSGIGSAMHSLLTGPRVSAATNEDDARRRRALSGATAGFGTLFAFLALFLGVVLHTSPG